MRSTCDTRIVLSLILLAIFHHSSGFANNRNANSLLNKKHVPISLAEDDLDGLEEITNMAMDESFKEQIKSIFSNKLSEINTREQTEYAEESKLKNIKSFSWSNCGYKTDPLKIVGLSIQPDPIRLPGTITVKFLIDLDDTVNKPLQAKVELQKREGPFWLTIPCIEDIGSCTYNNLCQKMANDTCPQVFVKNDIPCKCPFEKGSYSLPATSFDINRSIPSGDYRGTISLLSGPKTIACISLSATIN